MSRFSIFLSALFVLSALAGHALADTSNPPRDGDMIKLIPYPEPVPLPEVMLSSSDKGLVRLSEYRTNLVLLNIWATWCPPCVAELPSLNALQYSMAKDGLLKVVNVSIDTTGPEAVKKYMQDNLLTSLQPFIDVNGDVQKLEVLKGAAGVPVTLIIDPQNRVIGRLDGDADWNGKAARATIDYYLKNVSFSPI